MYYSEHHSATFIILYCSDGRVFSHVPYHTLISVLYCSNCTKGLGLICIILYETTVHPESIRNA